MNGFQKIVKKSSHWWKHGKHAKVDPAYIQNDRRPLPRTEPMYDSVNEAFTAAGQDRRRKK